MKDKLNSPAREKIRTAYDQILHEGMEKGMEKGRQEERGRKSFQVFKKGVSLGLPLTDLITLTEVSEETAQAWYALLQADLEAEWPGQNGV